MQQPNPSHLHRFGGAAPVSKLAFRPPLPTTKPPIRTFSHIPTKMQSLDQSVVSKFLQTVGEEKPTENGSPKPEVSRFKSDTIILSPQRSSLWKQRETTENEVVLRRNSTENDSASNGNGVPSWMNKSLKPVNGYREDNPSPTWAKKPTEAIKPTWNAKTLESSKTVRSQLNGTTSNGSVVNNRNSFSNTDWRAKYEESERKRKDLLGENQKVARDNTNLERRVHKLESDYQTLQTVHQEKVHQLNKLSQVSEKVYQDYDKLNNKYEVETSTLHKALGIASKWYTENKKLRRESVARTENQPCPLDETDGEDHALDELKKNVQELSLQVAQLQAELNQAKLLEFEAQEQYATLVQQLEEERQTSEKQKKELKELRLMRDKFESVTVMVQGEMQALRSQKEKALEDVKRLQGESHEAKRERNVLAHQSNLLMGDISLDDRMFNLLQEVEELKRKLEDKEQQHDLEIQDLQESIEAKEPDAQVEFLEEKLKLVECELQVALERAEKAEQSNSQLKNKVDALEEKTGPSSIPCPPPPPPPPPMPPMNGTWKTPARKAEGDSLDDMAKLLGIQRTPKPAIPQGGAINDLIKEIKDGKFTLKATEKVGSKQKQKEEQPPAVQEMLSIIGTLKRRPKHSKAQIFV